MSNANISDKSRTDVDRLTGMKDSDIDLSDNPELTAAQFSKGVVRKGLKPALKKSQVTLRIDSDVLDWFKKSGKGYQTRINILLRAYMEQSDRSGPDNRI